MKIAIVGGGISGLSAAHRLAIAGHEVICFEASGRPGGLMRSQRRDGFLCEVGPQAILDGSPEVSALIEEAGLSGRVCAPLAGARRRMIYVNGKLRTLPTGPTSLLSTDLLSVAGKWRLAREPFVRAKAPEGDQADESILEFATRRVGAEAARNIAAPAVIGLCAGDAAKLSMKSAFPRIAALEGQHGSLLKGMKAARRSGISAGKSVSFPEGMEELPRALAARLGTRVVSGKVVAVRRNGGRGWIVEIEEDRGPPTLPPPAPGTGGGEQSRGREMQFDAVVLALSPGGTAELLGPLLPEAAAGLRGLTLASVAVVALGFRRASVGMDLGAYGFLVARGEKATMLGCQYESTIFPGRAPEGAVLLRVILGGMFEPQVLELDDAGLVARAVGDLGLIAGLNQQPDFTGVWRLPRVMPQYHVGHERRVRAIEAAAATVPGLHLLGVGLRGIGLSDCIRNAAALARTIGPA